MATLRKRTLTSSPILPGDDVMSESTLEKERLLGFSDDEESIPPMKNGRGVTKQELAMPPSIASDVITDTSAQSQYTAEAEEVEGDIEIFNKAIHITNLEKVDHATLLHKMHDRFKKKVNKWEQLAYTYSRYAFAMNFTILLLQVLQMILQQTASAWMVSERTILMERQKPRTSFLHSLGIYKRSEWSGQAEGGSRASFSDFLNVVFSPQFIQTTHSLLTALTALIAGLQLKLKMSDKAERYRRGAKVYGRLLRISTYYIMMIESGGKIEDVTGLWREAMKKEGKWIPLVRTFVPL
ncbi:uncharacterized protein LOC120340790 isoform X2 [Styela clava]